MTSKKTVTIIYKESNQKIIDVLPHAASFIGLNKKYDYLIMDTDVIKADYLSEIPFALKELSKENIVRKIKLFKDKAKFKLQLTEAKLMAEDANETEIADKIQLELDIVLDCKLTEGGLNG